MEKIEAEIIMFSSKDGGRKSLLPGSAFKSQYRPHIVIGDRNQRKAVTETDIHNMNILTEKYQGVVFMDGPEVAWIPVNQKINVVLGLIYFPRLQYEDVVSGSIFTIREGEKIVGSGKIIKRWNS